MTSANGWFTKIKSRAQSVHETAKTRIEKLTVTLDKKLQEAQEDLEKCGYFILFLLKSVLYFLF